MIIDDHVHVHEWSYREGQPEYEVEHVIGQLDACGIDMAIIEDSLAYIGFAQEHSNDETRKAVEAYPDRLIGFANIRPQLGSKACREEIKRTIGNWNFRGIKLHPVVDRFRANDSDLVFPIVEMAMEYDVPIWFHTGHQPFATPTLVGDLALQFPDVKLIVGHMGHGLFYDAIMAARRHPSLFLEISQQGGHSFGVACKEVGAHRLIFGSDAPYANPAVIKKMVEGSSLSDNEKAMILGGNIAGLIGLPN